MVGGNPADEIPFGQEALDASTHAGDPAPSSAQRTLIRKPLSLIHEYRHSCQRI